MMSRHVKREWVVENTWVCASCRRDNRGRDMTCASCGNPKDRREEDVPAGPDAPEVTDPDLVSKALAGEDWVCAYCRSRVRNAEGKCANCAGGRPPARPLPEVGPRPPRRRLQARDRRLLVGMLLAAAALGVILFVLFRTREVEATVTHARWHRAERIEARHVVRKSGWGAPSEARNVACDRRYRGDEDCHPHDCRPHRVTYDCECRSVECDCRKECTSRKNGFSTCRETCSTCRRCRTCARTEYDTCYDRCPVYADHCDYDVDVWETARESELHGDGDEPRWPGLVAGEGERRIASERYQVEFGHGTDSDSVDVTAADFGRYRVGSRWARVSAVGTFKIGEEIR